MQGLGQSIFEEGVKEGLEQVRKEGLEKGIIGSIKILMGLGVEEEKIIEGLVKHYPLDKEKAKKYIVTVNQNMINFKDEKI